MMSLCITSTAISLRLCKSCHHLTQLFESAVLGELLNTRAARGKDHGEDLQLGLRRILPTCPIVAHTRTCRTRSRIQGIARWARKRESLPTIIRFIIRIYTSLLMLLSLVGIYLPWVAPRKDSTSSPPSSLGLYFPQPPSYRRVYARRRHRF